MIWRSILAFLVSLHGSSFAQLSIPDSRHGSLLQTFSLGRQASFPRNYRNVGDELFATSKIKKRRRIIEASSRSGMATRQGRFFNLFTAVTYLHQPCVTSSGRNGTCYPDMDCEKQGGVIDGYCASGYGVCCRPIRECGETFTENGTLFRNPVSNQRFCNVIIKKSTSRICQIKLSFESFDLLGPSSDGECQKDVFTINSNGRDTLKLCGSNTGEHVILPVEANEDKGVQLSVVLDTTVTIRDERKWKIRIYQYECSHPLVAPTGCLQYHQGVSGSIQSFNYRASSQPSQHLWKQSYSVCIRVEEGFCGIFYSQEDSDPFSFSLSSNDTKGPSMHRGAFVGESGCRKDYVIIPGGSGVQNRDPKLLRDRFCGNALGYCLLEVDSKGKCLIQSGPVISYMRPFIMGVVFDAYEEVREENNRGFKLQYHQVPC